MTSPDKNTTSYSAYYEENLYKLQNGVLNIVKESGTPFYLTGGTALSRGYYKHRYSDDLDFFINNDSNFSKHSERVIDALSANGYTWNSDTEFYKTVGFCTMKIHHKDFFMGLKIDFVNDIEAHFGELQETEFFYKTDSVFDRIKWITKPSWEQFQKDIKTISRDMLKLGENSLG